MTTSFSGFGFLPSIKQTLAEKNLATPTEIQIRAIPAMMKGKSVVGVSETGSGKTLAYALPILHILKTLENDGDKVSKDATPRAAIVVPTRELGEQVARVLKPYTHSTRVRVRSLLGGTTTEITRRNIKGQFEIIVATPGRLLQMMEQRLITVHDVRILIFDEADQMLDKGFLPEANKIASSCARGRQLGLFSATVSSAMQSLMKSLFSEAEVIRSKGSQKVVATLQTVNCPVIDGKRFPTFEKIISKPVKGGTIVFANTRAQVDTIEGLLTKKGLKCLICRGEMEKADRRANLKAFREGKADYLISTDLAARGLDVDHVERVINYHLPNDMDNYLHRVGRTARAGRAGTVFNLVTERDAPLMEVLGGAAPKPKVVSKAKPARPDVRKYSKAKHNEIKQKEESQKLKEGGPYRKAAPQKTRGKSR